MTNSTMAAVINPRNNDSAPGIGGTFVLRPVLQ